MKKILAATLALMMTAAVMTSCGSDDSSSKEESKADASSAVAESKAESKADAASGDESNATPKDVSEIPSALNNQETASFKFSTDMNVDDFVSQ